MADGQQCTDRLCEHAGEYAYWMGDGNGFSRVHEPHPSNPYEDGDLHPFVCESCRDRMAATAHWDADRFVRPREKLITDGGADASDVSREYLLAGLDDLRDWSTASKAKAAEKEGAAADDGSDYDRGFYAGGREAYATVDEMLYELLNGDLDIPADKEVSPPQVEDVNCPCGGVMVPNPGDVWVCVDCERSAELSWRWTDGE